MKKNASLTVDKLLNFVEKYYYMFLLCILAIAGVNLFVHLGAAPISSWDEARHGINAYEMIKNKNYIVNTFGYETDYYNLKPPLSYWFIMIGYKIFGFNALGLRFYSAVSAFLTIIIVAIFTKRKHGGIASLIASAVLTTTTHYILSHSARAGDADSIFVLLFTISMIAMIKIEENIKWLYLAALSFSLAFLAKSWHGFAIVAVGGLYLLFSGALRRLKLKQWFLFILSAIVPLGLWGIFRFLNDGVIFFKEMIRYDLLQRTTSAIEGHQGDILYYFHELEIRYNYFLIIGIAVFVGYLALNNGDKSKERRNYKLAMLLWIMVPFIAFSIAKTKLAWYILPIYPPFAICIGAFSQRLIRGEKRSFALQAVIILSLMFSVLINEKRIITEVRYPEIDYTQKIIEKIKNYDEYKGANAYTVCGTYGGPVHWDQNHFLAAELYGDLKPLDGGVEAFIKDSGKAIIVVPKDGKEDNIIKKYHLKVVLESDTNFILAK